MKDNAQVNALTLIESEVRKMVTKIILLATLAVAITVVSVSAYNNGFGEVPMRGYNSWCADVACGVDWCSEWQVKAIATAMMSNGLQSAGYSMIQMDDCWASDKRHADGTMAWNTTRFPTGIPALTKWLNDRGFLFGLYTSLGSEACEHHRLGSLGHYKQDAETFAEWGISRVKIDYCGGGLNRTAGGFYSQHKEFSDAFNKTGRPIDLFFCRGYGPHDPPPVPAWVQTLAQGARATNDHHDNWENSLQVINGVATAAEEASNKFAGWVASATEPGKLVNKHFWISVDMVYTGGQGCPPSNNISAHCPGQTDDQYRAFFSVAAFVSSDIMISTDVRYVSPVMNEALLNSEILGVQRDRSPIGTRLTSDAAGCRTAASGNCQIWTRKLADGSVAVLFLNTAAGTESFGLSMSVLFPDVKKHGAVAVPRDLWRHEDMDPVKVAGGSLEVFNLAPTSCKFFRVSIRNPW